MRRKLDRQGMAALFDSLIFLSVAATVSIVLLSSFGSPTDASSDRSAVDDAHAVLLRCTVPVADGKNATMLEAVASSRELTPEMEEMASSTLNELMPLMSWRWTYRSPQLSFALGDEAPYGCDVYASTVDVADGVLILQAWRA